MQEPSCSMTNIHYANGISEKVGVYLWKDAQFEFQKKKKKTFIMPNA